MNGKHNNQAGFGILAVALVAVVALGSTGYLVYEAHSKSKHPVSASSTTGTNSPASKQTATTDAGTAATVTQQSTYLDFREAGIQIALSSAISDATYASYYTQSSDGAKVYGISTKKLEADGSADSACSASHGALGIIRVTTTAPMKFVPPNSETPMTPDNKTLFKIGSSYYQYVAPQEYGCSDGGKVSAADMQTAQAAVAQSFISVRSDAR